MENNKTVKVISTLRWSEEAAWDATILPKIDKMKDGLD